MATAIPVEKTGEKSNPLSAQIVNENSEQDGLRINIPFLKEFPIESLEDVNPRRYFLSNPNEEDQTIKELEPVESNVPKRDAQYGPLFGTPFGALYNTFNHVNNAVRNSMKKKN